MDIKKLVVCSIVIGILFWSRHEVQVRGRVGENEQFITQTEAFFQNQYEDMGREDEVNNLTEEVWKEFFECYFGMEEEWILLLNQRASTVNTFYWELYEAQTDIFLKIFEPYLAEEVIRRKGKEELLKEFHMPRMIEVGQYIINGNQQVEDVEIKSIQPLGEYLIYEIEVRSKGFCMDKEEVNRRYEWSDEKGYYILKQKDSYLFLQNKTIQDTIKVKQTYFIKVKNENSLAICEVKEGAFFEVNDNDRRLITNNTHIEQLPYELKKEQIGLAKQTMLKIFDQPKTFFQYYQKAYEASQTQFELLFFMNLGMQEEIIISKEYKMAYNKEISPYKDGIQKIEVNLKEIVCLPTDESTQNHPAIEVIIPAKVLLLDNTTTQYEYTYHIGLQENKVRKIHLLKTSVKAYSYE